MTPEAIARSLNPDWSVRVFVDSVSYSNPMPDWHEGLNFPYADVASRIEENIIGHVKGTESVVPPLNFLVPYRACDFRLWLVPTLTEQIILQACAAQIGSQLPISTDTIFSYQFHPDHEEFLENQLDQWGRFQDKTSELLESNDYILQIDIKKAFANIQREHFFSYLRSQFEGEEVIKLLEGLLNGWMGGQPGLPLINDSLFFLGNGYFSIVDQIIERYTQNYIRFVDDYRIFGKSEAELESIYESINRDISTLGFSINESKVRLGSSASYLGGVGSVNRIDGTDFDEDYFGTLIFKRVVDPEQLVGIVAKMVKEPDRYLNVRLGRFVLREIKKYHTIGADGEIVKNSYLSELARNTELRNNIRKIIKNELTVPNNQWRLIWSLYIAYDIVVADAGSEELTLIRNLSRNMDKNSIPWLWAKRIISGQRNPRPVNGDQLAYMGINYQHAGTLFYGE